MDTVVSAVQQIDASAAVVDNFTFGSASAELIAEANGMFQDSEVEMVDNFLSDMDKINEQLDSALGVAHCANASKGSVGTMEVPDNSESTTKANAVIVAIVLMVLVGCAFCFVTLVKRRRKKDKSEVAQNPEVVEGVPEKAIEPLPEPESTREEEESVSLGIGSEPSEVIIEEVEVEIQCGQAFGYHS